MTISASACCARPDEVAVLRRPHRELGVIDHLIAVLGRELVPERAHDDAVLLVVGEESHLPVALHHVHGQELLLGHLQLVEEHVPGPLPSGLVGAQERPDRRQCGHHRNPFPLRNHGATDDQGRCRRAQERMDTVPNNQPLGIFRHQFGPAFVVIDQQLDRNALAVLAQHDAALGVDIRDGSLVSPSCIRAERGEDARLRDGCSDQHFFWSVISHRRTGGCHKQ